VDHVIAPLDADHTRVVAQLSIDLATALALDPESVTPRPPHITIASYTAFDPTRATAVLEPVLSGMGPVTVRALGYGIFTGDADSDLSLHVMVVRTRALDDLHRRVHAALTAAGACLAGTTDPNVWTPHITLLDRGLTPRLLGQAVELLACRPHRTWSITVTSLAITRRREDLDGETALAFGAVHPPSA
jgi:2'-5' RNA ligase